MLGEEVEGIDALAASIVSRGQLHGALCRVQEGRSAVSDFQVVRDAGDEFQDCAVGGEKCSGCRRKKRDRRGRRGHERSLHHGRCRSGRG